MKIYWVRVGSTPLTVFHRLFWNFADVFCMEWRCACGLDIILWFFFLTFSALWTDCFETLQIFSAWNEDVHVVLVQYFYYFSALWTYLFFWHEMVSKCIESGYIVGTTPLTVFFWLFWNFADVFCMEWRCASGFGIILYLHLPLTFRRWTILDQLASSTDEGQLIARRCH